MIFPKGTTQIPTHIQLYTAIVYSEPWSYLQNIWVETTLVRFYREVTLIWWTN